MLGLPYYNLCFNLGKEDTVALKTLLVGRTMEPCSPTLENTSWRKDSHRILNSNSIIVHIVTSPIY